MNWSLFFYIMLWVFAIWGVLLSLVYIIISSLIYKMMKFSSPEEDIETRWAVTLFWPMAGFVIVTDDVELEIDRRKRQEERQEEREQATNIFN